MKLNIAVLAGDGIGPEIMQQAIKVVNVVCEKKGHEVKYTEAVTGAAAIDAVGDPYPDSTHKICMEADAVLFGAIGHPRFDNDPTAKVRPEQGLLRMRKQLGLYANIRPVETFPSLLHKSPLRKDLVEGADFICIRELTGVSTSAIKGEATTATLHTIRACTQGKRSKESSNLVSSMR